MSKIESLSLVHAREIAVSSQLLTASHAPRNMAQTMGALGCIQIDAMQAVRRSHELALLARNVESTTPSATPASFETWGHAHSLVAMTLWPHLEWRRRRIREKGLTGPEVDPACASRVINVIRAEGPMTLSQLESARGAGWDRQSPSRWACEWLLSVGDLAVVDRNEKWQRVYALPEWVIPDELLGRQLSDDECIRSVVHTSLSALGVATTKDVADYFRIDPAAAAQVLSDSNARPVSVEGSADVWYVSPGATVGAFDADSLLPLSPLDSLVWTRRRQQALFGKSYLLESYKSPAKREFGYFGMPLLRGTELVGRVAARRKGMELRIEALQTDYPIEPHHLERLFALLGRWSGCPMVSSADLKLIA